MVGVELEERVTMTDKIKTWQEVAKAVTDGGRARGMIDIGELWNAVEEMSDRIQELEKDAALGRSVRAIPRGWKLMHSEMAFEEPWVAYDYTRQYNVEDRWAATPDETLTKAGIR